MLLWGGLGLLGLTLIASVTEQHVFGFPNDAQRMFYVRIPFAILATALVAYFLSFTRRVSWLFFAIQILALLCFFPYLLFFGGGV